MRKSLPLWKLRKVCFFACWLKQCLLNLEHNQISSFHKLWSKIWIKRYTFCCFASKLTRSTICYGLRNIWIDLSEYWSFYGLKLPPKFSFSRNFVHFVSSNSLTIWNFSKTLVFVYSQFTWAIVHALKKNLNKNFVV